MEHSAQRHRGLVCQWEMLSRSCWLTNDGWRGVVGDVAGKVRLVVKVNYTYTYVRTHTHIHAQTPLVERTKVMTSPPVGGEFSVKSTS